MNDKTTENCILRVWFDSKHIFIQTSRGEIKSDLLAKYPRLQNASESERSTFKISPLGIHWKLIDEDLSLNGFL